MSLTEKSNNKNFINGIDYVPAELQKGSSDEWRIVFYVKDISSDKLVRVRKRVKPMPSKRTRQKFANDIIISINQKLAEGWNPFLFNNNRKSYSLLSECLDEFIEKINKREIDRVIRVDTKRAYSSYINNIKKYLAYEGKIKMFVIDYNRRFVADFLDYIYYERDNSPATHNNHLQFMVNIGNYFLDRGYIASNPALGIRRIEENEKIRVIIPVAYRDLIKKYLEEYNPSYLCLCMTTFYCFIRRTELTKLKVSDLRLAKSLIVVKTSTAKKSKKEATVTIPIPLIYLLVNHIKNASQDMYLFSADNYQPGYEQLQPKKISDEWDKMRNKLELPPNFQFYSLKDTGITELLDKGHPSYKVQKQARHSELRQTEKYISNRHYDRDEGIFRNSNTF